jgi:hypothetical protein
MGGEKKMGQVGEDVERREIAMKRGWGEVWRTCTMT